ncbi:MAG: hypothetical protein IIY29_01300, partial [Firmicutes bacterium]|nr:hypothetical protein [Bacillota bacterium]
MKRLLALLLCLAMVLGMSALMAGCGGSDSSDSSGGGSAETAAAVDEAEFLYGSWFAETATQDGQEMDAKDFFNGHTVSWYFSDDGTTTIWVDQNRALVDWTLRDGGVTLQGDLTYEADFVDETKTSMIWHYDVND